MLFRSRRALVLSIASACTLSSCKAPTPPVDFAPEPGQSAITIAPTAGTPLVAAPVELPSEQHAANVGVGGQCNLEHVNGRKFAGQPVPVSKDVPVQLSGWIADVDAKSVPAAFDVRLVAANNARTWRIPSQAGGLRADVQALLGGDAAFAATGFTTEFDVASLPDGTYRAYVVFEKNGAMLACDNGRAIVVD